MTKFWKKFDFWVKIKATLAAFGAGGEITLLLNDVSAKWHVITVIATIGSIFITNFIQDSNNNGIVDTFETKKQARESSKQI